MGLKQGVKSLLLRFGYEIRHASHDRGRPLPFGQNPFKDMKQLVATKQPVIFDVGANVGQSVERFRKWFDRPVIHSFEPDDATFGELQRQWGGVANVRLNNVALGAHSGTMELFVSGAGSPMNSLLEPGPEGVGLGVVVGKKPVNVATLDDYCDTHRVRRIDILKTDTQGFDLEVLRGGEEMLRKRAIHLVHIEINFSDMYKGQPRLDEIFGFLADRGFALVTFYPFYYWGPKASWTEGLFIHPGYTAHG